MLQKTKTLNENANGSPHHFTVSHLLAEIYGSGRKIFELLNQQRYPEPPLTAPPTSPGLVLF